MALCPFNSNLDLAKLKAFADNPSNITTYINIFCLSQISKDFEEKEVNADKRTHLLKCDCDNYVSLTASRLNKKCRNVGNWELMRMRCYDILSRHFTFQEVPFCQLLF